MANAADFRAAQDRQAAEARVEAIYRNRGADIPSNFDRLVDRFQNDPDYSDVIRDHAADDAEQQSGASMERWPGAGDGAPPPDGMNGTEPWQPPQTDAEVAADRRDAELEQDRQRDARARINEFLSMYGLNGLADWAWNMIQQGHSSATVLQELRTRPEYKQRFPAMGDLRDKGRAISEAQYIDIERQRVKIARQFGLPEGFYDDPTDHAAAIASEQSVREFEDRLTLWKRVAEEKAADPANQDTLEELNRLYGISPDSGEFLSMVIDSKRALPTLQKRVDAAAMGATAMNVGFGTLSRAEAERLGGSVGAEEARSGFGTLVESRELFNPLTGREQVEQSFSRDDQFGAVFDGDRETGRAIERQSRRRVAEFEGGGGFSSSREGLSGLGRAR